MIYLKSVLAGLIALVVIPAGLLMTLVIGMLIYASVHPPSGEGSIGWDPISLYRANPVVLLVPVLIFLTGFVWEYRRVAK